MAVLRHPLEQQEETLLLGRLSLLGVGVVGRRGRPLPGLLVVGAEGLLRPELPERARPTSLAALPDRERTFPLLGDRVGKVVILQQGVKQSMAEVVAEDPPPSQVRSMVGLRCMAPGVADVGEA